MESYLTVSETADYLNTSERFVRRLIAERRIAFHHVGRHVRVALSDVEAWLARPPQLNPTSLKNPTGMATAREKEGIRHC